MIEDIKSKLPQILTGFKAPGLSVAILQDGAPDRVLSAGFKNPDSIFTVEKACLTRRVRSAGVVGVVFGSSPTA